MEDIEIWGSLIGVVEDKFYDGSADSSFQEPRVYFLDKSIRKDGSLTPEYICLDGISRTLRGLKIRR